MAASALSPLASLELRLRHLLPADLYAAAWVNPVPENLTRCFEHLRTLQRTLRDYVPRVVAETPPQPGEVRYEWQEGALMFTDLAGFTPLLEANAAAGEAGAETLLGVLNNYFADMIEIVSKSSGNLLEFTGDAMLVQFPADPRGTEVVKAVRAGLRMQRAMAKYANIQTDHGALKLGMRVGIHAGRFLMADIGTPHRMAHVLLGQVVQRTKRAEGSGEVGRVCLTDVVSPRVQAEFRFEPGSLGHVLVVDDLSTEELGEYEVAGAGRRQASSLLLDRSVEGLVSALTDATTMVEPLACYMPAPVLDLVIDNMSRRRVPPDFTYPTVLFVNLIGLPEALEEARPGEEAEVVNSFSHLFALINAAVETRGGVLKSVTYHLAGSDMLIMFGAPSRHTDDPVRGASAAQAIRDLILQFPAPAIGGKPVTLSCQMGMAFGAAFAAEIGEPRGRREYNVLGDTINTAARLMGRAIGNRVLMTEAAYEAIKAHFKCDSLGVMPLKGKARSIPVYALKGPRE